MRTERIVVPDLDVDNKRIWVPMDPQPEWDAEPVPPYEPGDKVTFVVGGMSMMGAPVPGFFVHLTSVTMEERGRLQGWLLGWGRG